MTHSFPTRGSSDLINQLGELLVGEHGQEYFTGLQRNLEILEVVTLENLDMTQRRFDQCIGIRLAIFFLQLGFQRTRSEEHTSELQSLMRLSYSVFFLKKNKYRTLIQISMRS